MLPTNVCRTCALQDDNLLALSSHSKKYPERNICDMLDELTHNDPLWEHSDDNLPQHLCGPCLIQLEAAYAFLLQARQAQERLLLQLRKGLQTKCLEEMPIDITLQNIKAEVDIDLYAETNTEMHEEFEVEDADKEEENEKNVAAVSVTALKCLQKSDSDSSEENLDEEIMLSPETKRYAPNPQQENISFNYCTCTTSVRNIENKIDIQTELIKNLQAQYDQIAGQNVIIRQLVQGKNQSEEVLKLFPLQNEEDMLRLEEAIGPDTRQIYVTAMKSVLAPIGIKKGLPRILSDTIIEQYNIHGVKAKKGFISLPKFYRALLDSIPDSASGDVEEELRRALVAQKKNFFKKMSLKRKAEANVVRDVEFKRPQLRRSARRAKPSTDSENYTTSDLACLQPAPVKRGRGRPARQNKTETINEDGRHMCKVCDKTYSWYRDLQRHERTHFEQAAYVCESCGKKFLRKDKYMFHLRTHEKQAVKVQALQRSGEWRYAERLYSSGRLKCVECKLCGLKCQRIKELREHLASHSNIETLSSLSMDNDVIREQFGNQWDLQQIRQQVCTQIAQGREQLENFCVVVNAYGYELCLSDSDEEVPGVSAQYQCLPCNASFTRKHRLIRHTLEKHSQANETETPWVRCNICQIGFVCGKLLEQHQRTQCLNPLKRYSCDNCPGKFIWLQNLQQHDCSRLQQDQQQAYQQIQCCLCDAKLNSMSALRSHLLTHRDGHTGIDPQQDAAFFRTYYQVDMDCNLSELSARIAGDFQSQNVGRYFNACTDSGQELDFNDSDTALSNAPILHSCAVCGESTQALAQLQQHQESQHNELDKKLPHICADCGLGFVSKSLLQQHRRRICGKLQAKYNCRECNQRFYWLSNYERHMQLKHAVGTGEAPIEKQKLQTTKLQCTECDKVFIWPKDLTRHKRMHQSQVQFECNFCERKFHRKDNLKSHMRMHGGQQMNASTIASEQQDTMQQRMPTVLSHLSRPNGCKQIQCMICLSQHAKISDLRTHLSSHQFALRFSGERSQPESISSICRAFYPELSTPLDKQDLIKRIQSDLANCLELERFISITSEAGIELSLDSSETDTDSDSADNQRSSNGRFYTCELCQVRVTRKHQLYAHQLKQHTWEQAAHVCSHCQARFVNEQLLEHHYRTLCRNAQRRFICRKCPLRFRWRDNLKLHVDVAHRERNILQHANKDIQLHSSRSYDCVECKRSFKMQKDLTRHTLMHTQESSIYRCHWCARRFYRQSNLLQHIERHGISADQLPYAEALLNANRHPHGQKCIQCKVCELPFASISALRSHLTSAPVGTHHAIESMLNYSITDQLGYELHLEDSETDEEAKPKGTPAHYTCGMCQLRCVRKFELVQHQQAMHRLERISEGCELCIFKSVSPDLIAYHRRVLCGNTEKQFKCSKCSYRFMWQSNLEQHMLLQHPISGEPSLMPALDIANSEGQIFQCGQCPSKYNRKDRLTAHVKKCHADGATASKKSSANAKQQKSFLCAFCGKAVSSSSNLIIHIRRHTGEKPFKCDFCDMAFPRSSDLQCHRRTHTGERPHVCTVCQKGFARSYKLQQHMRIHNGERPYKCTYCDKSFTQSNDLTLHIRRHTGERPYQCNTCGERFIQGTALKNHRQQNGHFQTEGEHLKDD